MKKTYITPNALTIVLGTKQTMLIESLPINNDTTNPDPITDPDEILTNEFKSTNIWDEEW